MHNSYITNACILIHLTFFLFLFFYLFVFAMLRNYIYSYQLIGCIYTYCKIVMRTACPFTVYHVKQLSAYTQ